MSYDASCHWDNVPSYPDARPTLAECIREEQADPIECVYCGRMTDPDHPCHDQDTGE